MIVSLDWLKEYANIKLNVDELSTLIGARLVEIEEVVNLGDKYDGALVVRVVECSPIEGSDHLSLALIDDGGVNGFVERNSQGLVQVVCGAQNIRSGINVAWLPPKSIVPQTYGKDNFVLESRKLLGHVSNGMIASSAELDLSDDHDGILELSDDYMVGASLKDVLRLDDYLLDIENKSLTHRPDCFGIIGFAREVSAIQGDRFKTPEWLQAVDSKETSNHQSSLKITATIEDTRLSDRYGAVVLGGFDGSMTSPIDIQILLSKVGVRPINAVVDVTNYLMMLTGQPLHAFDYDKMASLNGGKVDIRVRGGRDNEKLQLLDGKTIELSSSDIVIANGDIPVALAGAMGGLSTAIDSNTKNIVIESATFNLYNLRATQMRHGVFSEAITRFTKGQPAELAMPVLRQAIKLLSEWSSIEVVGDIVEDYPVKQEQILIDFDVNSINAVLGTDFDAEAVRTLLDAVEIKTDQKGDRITARIPYWRADLRIVEDIVEEVGRINGFDNIKPVLPRRHFEAVRPSVVDNFKDDIRRTLRRAGANEVLTYSFVHGDIIKKASQSIDNSYKIVNSISPELQYYRQSLTPSILSLVQPNFKQHYQDFVLFEINKVHQKSDGLNDENVPVELDRLALAVTGKATITGAAYYSARRYLDFVCNQLNIDVSYKEMENASNNSLMSPFEPKRSAIVTNNKTGEEIGIVGEYRKNVMKNFKLPELVAGFEVDVDKLLQAQSFAPYSPISRFPSSERDLCFKVESSVKYSEVYLALLKSIEGIDLETTITPIDIYEPQDKKTKNITIRLKITAHDHTLISQEVDNVVDTVSKAVVSATNAIIV